MKLALAIFCIFAFGLSNAQAGIDRLYEKDENKLSWSYWASKLSNDSVYGKSYALVVGVSDYKGGFSKLPTEQDAPKIMKYLLDEAGFDYVHLLTEEKVTLSRVRELMLGYFKDHVGKKDRFFFFWSGHGVDQENANNGSDGFLALSDSDPKPYLP